MNRNGSRLIAVLLVIALLTGSVCASDVNTETRHTVATALSADAQSYYVGAFSFRYISASPGRAGTPDMAMHSDLFSVLHDLMSSTMTRSYSYESLVQHWYSSDSSAAGGTCLFYSDAVRPRGEALTREHVWAKSHGTFYESGAGSDLHHMRPEDYDVNTTRSNFTFGNVRSERFSWRTQSLDGREVLWYDANYFDNGCRGLVEVADDVKGDVARILLYVYVTYEQPNLCTNTAATGEGDLHSDGRKVIESLDTLLDWCRRDPVDTWEMRRNDIVQSLQGNRNVFIDYPELAWMLFDRPLPDMLTPSGYARQNQGGDFWDVPQNAWYRPGVDYVVSAGLMNGVGQRRFAPDQTLTRAQLVTVLYRQAGSPDPGGARNHFPDVPSDTWYTKAVTWASQRGIMVGYPDGKFRPNDPITREQLVTVLYRYNGAKPAGGDVLSSFPDRGRVSSYARDAMGWAVSCGLISGVKTAQGVLLCPKDSTTRAQFAVILQRWLE